MPGLPESLSYEEVGGEKIDYTAPVDTSTDRSAEEVNSVFCASTQMSRMSPRAWIRFNTHVTAAPVLEDWEAVWKGATATLPTLTYTGTGAYTITFPSSVNDERGDAHNLNFRACWFTTDDVLAIITYSVTPNTINLVINTNGAEGDVSLTLDCFVL